MKLRALLIFVLPLALIAAGQKVDKKKTASAAKAKQVKVVALTVPKDATLVEPGTWRYVDGKKKVWIYRSTPFGITRFEEPVAVAEEVSAAIKAVEDGDNVRFERQSPFGAVTWTKKKGELSETERQVWERDRPKPVDATPAAPAKPVDPQTGTIKPDVKE